MSQTSGAARLHEQRHRAHVFFGTRCIQAHNLTANGAGALNIAGGANGPVLAAPAQIGRAAGPVVRDITIRF